ncbi:MAG: hypothetical protein ACYTF3_07635 [Planctomycetota bacterium]
MHEPLETFPRRRMDERSGDPTRWMRLAPLLLLALGTLGCQSAESAPEAAGGPVPPSWEVVCTWLRVQTDALTDDMSTAREALVARAESEAPELVARLEPAPPRTSGWGLLPELIEDGPTHAVVPVERRYALQGISVNFASTFRDGRILAEHTSRDPEQDLEAAVIEYERVRGDMQNLQAHLSYHEQWQASVVDSTAYFRGRNEVVAQARELDALVKEGHDEPTPRMVELEAAIREELEVFHEVSFLALEDTGDGQLVLPVRVLTDIDDEAFLAAFAEAVDDAWSGSEAAREQGLSIELVLEPVDLGTLYPEGAPEVGQTIDPKEHVARFPVDTLVMTTGGKSTHAWNGRCLVLGPGTIAPRTLAHEFGHLLGFSDSYLRGFDGRLDDPYGVVLVEWTGLLDDLMGNVSGGVVREPLVDRLVTAYGP